MHIGMSHSSPILAAQMLELLMLQLLSHGSLQHDSLGQVVAHWADNNSSSNRITSATKEILKPTLSFSELFGLHC